MRIVALTLCGLALASAVSANDTNGYRHAIFNGKNLDGWHVTGCEVSVEDNAMVLQGGDGFIHHDHRYSDFVLELSWRARKAEAWDSGIYIRSELPRDNKPWPERYQINLKQGDEGNLIGLPMARSQGLVKDGQWNSMKLTVVGDTARMEINGQHAWDTNGISASRGYIGFQSEVPLGGQFEFRDIFVTEIGFQSLFNGKDLAGWEGAGQDASRCWTVEDELLLCTGKMGPWLRSKERYADFNVRLEYKLKEGGNSGVYLRVPEDGNHHGSGAGVEIQILDDKSERYKELKPYQYSGSVYAVAPALQHVGKPVGEWNTLEINCRGFTYLVTHNGVVIVHACEEAFPELKERLHEGFIGLQNHSEEVWFRNLRVGPPQ